VAEGQKEASEAAVSGNFSAPSEKVKPNQIIATVQSGLLWATLRRTDASSDKKDAGPQVCLNIEFMKMYDTL
jgi:hypothetical protein